MVPSAASLLTILLMTACAAAGPRRGSSNVLTREEISRSNGATAFEVVQELRPHYLRARGPSSGMNPAPAYPTVYLNDFRAGGLEALRSIRIVEIEEIRYISAADATTRWGTGHTAGVIQVRSQH
jgi:hypothetical protein